MSRPPLTNVDRLTTFDRHVKNELKSWSMIQERHLAPKFKQSLFVYNCIHICIQCILYICVHLHTFVYICISYSLSRMTVDTPDWATSIALNLILIILQLNICIMYYLNCRQKLLGHSGIIFESFVLVVFDIWAVIGDLEYLVYRLSRGQ